MFPPLHYRHLPHPVDDLPVLFASSLARRVSVVFLSLFSPIYLFQIFSSRALPLKFALTLVLTYFFLVFLAKLFTLSFAENLGLKIGYRGILLFSGLPFLLFIPFLIKIDQFPLLFIPAALSLGAHGGLFWWGYHGFFIKSGKAPAFGQELGTTAGLDTLAQFASPLLGAFIITQLGFNFLFWLSGLIFLFSLALLIPTSEKKPHADIKLKQTIQLILAHKVISLAYFGHSSSSAWYSSIWPLFIFLVLGTTLGVGEVVSASVIIAALITFLVGLQTDKGQGKKIISFGSPLLSFSWVLRFLGQNPLLFVVADSLWRFADGMVGLPLNVLTYHKALESSSGQAIMFRELILVIGQLFSLSLLILWVLLGLDLALSFLLAAAFALLPAVSMRIKS